ncbi:hypothetical protein [Phascolarctobacterium succinatutens]|uniref:hypothetical protein n=1 Tax=Phascolarctobacterium succinatutens TaxID=626940 RepID=UPI0026EAED3F|nr:hypothetical protein [Phascolarctobacterium succinatutens]
MIKAMQAAQKAARKAIESTYTGVMTVSERQSVKDPNTHITSTKEVVVLENQPCKLSFETIAATAQTETAASLTQGTKLFLPPNVKIKAGSKIIVEQDGVKNAYSASGVPAVYPTHQEIILTLFERWA